MEDGSQQPPIGTTCCPCSLLGDYLGNTWGDVNLPPSVDATTPCKAPVSPDKWLFLRLNELFSFLLQISASHDSRYRDVKVLAVWTLPPGLAVCDWISPQSEHPSPSTPPAYCLPLHFLPPLQGAGSCSNPGAHWAEESGA